ncbi:unnamed protein product [Scytosiphon promiscuus]
MVKRPRDERQRRHTRVALALLLLFCGIPSCRPFAGPNVNLRLTSCGATSGSPAKRCRRGSTILSALAEAPTDGNESGANDVISGSNQLEGWKANTGGSSGIAEAPKRSNVMGRAAARTTTGGGDPAAIVGGAGDAAPAPLPVPQRALGGAVHEGGVTGDAPGWKVEAAITSAELLVSFQTALAAREQLMRKLMEEETDCYRLFHGAVEGCPGLTVDRYGTVVLVQTFRDPPVDFDAQAVEEICRLASDAINAAEAGTAAATAPTTPGAAVPGTVSFLPVWNDRRKKERRRRGGGSGAEYGEDAGPPPHKLTSDHEPLPEALGVKVGLENGVRYPLAARHRGIDPWLFLDLRSARKWMLTNCEGMEVLNLFSYTGGVAAAAACGGAKSVWNIDFSASAHEVGRASLKLNAGSAGECKCEWMKRDVLPSIRQLAGTPTKDYRQDRRGRNAKIAGGRHSRDARGDGGGSGGYNKARRIRFLSFFLLFRDSRGRGGGRGGRGSDMRSNGYNSNGYGGERGAKQFDVVFLDPPTWSKSKHGAVDLVRDYQTLFKPSLLSTKEGGTVVATNHVSTVDCAEWMESLSRCATKAGRTVQSVQVLVPEEDFPSPDGRHPLKIAIVRV